MDLMKNLCFVLSAVALLMAPAAHAEDLSLSNPKSVEGESGLRSRFRWSDFLERSSASVSTLLTGPSAQSLDGNRDGRGTNLLLRFYPSYSYDITKVVSLGIGDEIRKYFRPMDPKNPNKSSWEARDPYVGFYFYKFINVRRSDFSVSGKFRYYVPVSSYTKSYIGKNLDSGNGQINAGLSPAKKFLDGKLYTSVSTDYYYRIAQRPPRVREDHTFKINPLVSYSLSRKVDYKVEYSTGYIRHSTDGKWSKLNDPILGHTVSTGITWYPTRKWSVSPSVSWGKNTWRIADTEISVYSSLTLL